MVCDWTAVKDSIHLPLSYFIEDLDIVKLDNKDEALVRNSSVTVSDNYILIHCSQSIPFKLFDRKGKFLRNIGSVGNGPGEYTQVGPFQLDEKHDRIYLMPWNATKLITYNLNGELQKNIPLIDEAEKWMLPKSVFYADGDKGRITVATLPWKNNPRMIWVQDFEGNRLAELSPITEMKPDYSNDIYHKTGEISIHAEEMTLLSKSLQILPEKFHGLTDTDMRYRQRYIDLIMNQESKEVFVKRSKILKEIRNFLADRDFMEVETPMLVANAGGAAARPFETHYNALNEDVKLRISLELYLKRLIVGGLERVYEIGRVFRNEGVDTRHNPEFTLMELYQAYTDYEGMMELTESMFRYLAEKVCGSTKISYNGIEIDLGKPFTRMTMNDAIKKYTGIDFDTVEDDAAAKKLADEHHIAYEERHKKGDIINLFFE